MRYLWAILLILAATLPVLFGMSSVGVAQPSDSQPRAESPDDGPPPGGCNPIGVTASGEIVFPMTCKDFIERHKAADRDSSAAETKPAVAEASRAPATVGAGKATTTAEANKASATADVSSAPAAVEAIKAPTAAEARGAPTTADPGKLDKKDAKPAAAKAPADEAARPVTKQSTVAPAPADTVNSAAEPATTAALPKRTRARVAGSPSCTKFRTYDAASGTYRDFGGQRRPCP
jgi:hypothetical protein